MGITFDLGRTTSAGFQLVSHLCQSIGQLRLVHGGGKLLRAEQKDCYQAAAEPARDGKLYAEVTIKRDLKRRARKRKLMVQGEAKEILDTLVAASGCEYVFTHPTDHTRPLPNWALENQMGRVRSRINSHPDSGLHALRHTFLTEAGSTPIPSHCNTWRGTIRLRPRCVTCIRSKRRCRSCLCGWVGWNDRSQS